VGKKKTSTKQWHLKGFEPIDLGESGKKSILHTSKLHGYTNINVIGGVPNGMCQWGLDLLSLNQQNRGGGLKGS